MSSVDCTLCDAPEVIEHCFIDNEDITLFLGVLLQKLRKHLDLTPHSVEPCSSVR